MGEFSKRTWPNCPRCGMVQHDGVLAREGEQYVCDNCGCTNEIYMQWVAIEFVEVNK